MPEILTNIRKQIMRQPWGLYWIQARRLTSIEVRRNLFSWRASWIYFLAFIPTLIILIHAAVGRHFQSSMSEDTSILAGIIQFYSMLNGIAAEGLVKIDAVAPADDDANAIYQYLIGSDGSAS